jgi:hypothetical protein
MFLDPFKKNVINHLAAAGEGKPFASPMGAYFRAFTGAFEPDMPFTFYFEARDKPILFVYDATPIDRRSSHAAFIARCDDIKSRILPITRCVQELAAAGFLETSPLDYRDRPALPVDYAHHWRKYKQFYNDVMTGLSFVCCSRLEPTRKLYELWGKVSAKALAG